MDFRNEHEARVTMRGELRDLGLYVSRDFSLLELGEAIRKAAHRFGKPELIKFADAAEHLAVRRGDRKPAKQARLI